MHTKKAEELQAVSATFPVAHVGLFQYVTFTSRESIVSNK